MTEKCFEIKNFNAPPCKSYEVMELLLLGAGITSAQWSHPMGGAALFRDVEAYAAEGLHRTGTDVDLSTSEWVATGLANAGFDVEFVNFTVKPFYDYTSCSLSLDGVDFTCYPVWLPAAATSLASVAIGNKLGEVRIVEVDSPSLGGDAGDAITAAIEAGAAGVLVSNRNIYCADSPVALNAPAPYTTTEWKVPVVLIGCGALAAFGAAPPTVLTKLAVAGSSTESATSRNVVGTLRIDGNGGNGGFANHSAGPTPLSPHLDPRLKNASTCGVKRVIVSTPISGWFHCGGERGPGVAIFRALSRALPRVAASRLNECESLEMLFVATSGHELGDMGAELNLRTLEERGWGVESGVDAFVSLGASIITWQNITGAGSTPDGIYRSPLCYNTETLGDALVGPFAEAGFDAGLNRSDLAGELLKVIGAGYSAFGFYGDFYRFHTPEDDAESTSPELLELAAKATFKSIKRLLFLD